MRRDAGQTATEYMLLLSVLVVAVVASAYVFVPEFQGGVAQLAQDASVMLATGEIGGIGFARHAANSGGNGGGIDRGDGGTVEGAQNGGGADGGASGNTGLTDGSGSGGASNLGSGSAHPFTGSAEFDRSGDATTLGVATDPASTAGSTGAGHAIATTALSNGAPVPNGGDPIENRGGQGNGNGSHAAPGGGGASTMAGP